MVRHRASAAGDHANIVSKNEDFAAKLERVISNLGSDSLPRVDVAQTRTTIDLSLDATAPERAPDRPNLESVLAHFFRLPLTAEVELLAS
jgi:hypothetical protein